MNLKLWTNKSAFCIYSGFECYPNFLNQIKKSLNLITKPNDQLWIFVSTEPPRLFKIDEIFLSSKIPRFMRNFFEQYLQVLDPQGYHVEIHVVFHFWFYCLSIWNKCALNIDRLNLCFECWFDATLLKRLSFPEIHFTTNVLFVENR